MAERSLRPIQAMAFVKEITDRLPAPLEIYADRIGLYVAVVTSPFFLYMLVLCMKIAAKVWFLGLGFGVLVFNMLLLMWFFVIRDWRYLRIGNRLPVFTMSKTGLRYRDDFEVPWSEVIKVEFVTAVASFVRGVPVRRRWVVLQVKTPGSHLGKKWANREDAYRRANRYFQVRDEPTRLVIDPLYFPTGPESARATQCLEELQAATNC